MTTLTPPPFVQKFAYQSCKQINLEGKRLYQTPDGHKTPSVTTILSAVKDQTHLIEWRKRIGHDKAQQITKEASGVGTAMHNNLERFVAGMERLPGKNLVHVKAHGMASVIIEKGLSQVNEIWAIEQSLYYPELYSGTTDMVCLLNGEPAIADYKQTLKPKKPEWVEDYYLQLTAYALAHNKVYGTDIRRGAIFMCSQGLEYQQFDLLPADFNKYEDKWWTAVETYFKKVLNEATPG